MRVKNWHKFQHFKDRKPLWVKLYRDILDDIEWHELDGQSAKSLVMIWLIASENGGALPSTKELSFRLRMTEKVVESIISKLGHWLEQDDIKLISDGYQADALERERETEERQRERQIARPSKRCPDDFVPNDLLLAQMRAEFPHVDLILETKKFRDYTFASAKSDWPATWRNWIRRAAENRKGASHGRQTPGQILTEGCATAFDGRAGGGTALSALRGDLGPPLDEPISVAAIAHRG